MPSFKRALLIRNPTAGVSWSQTVTQQVIHDLTEWIPSLEIATTQAPGHATRLAEEATRQGCDLVIAAGGDGTFNEAINGIIGTETALAFLPVGTGNSIAYEFHLPLHPVKAVKSLRNGEVRKAYLGIANGRYFGLMISFGFDACAVQQVPYRLKRMFGRLSYIVAGSIALLRYPYPVFTVVADGETFTASTVIISKSQYYASRFRIAPEASLETPDFQVCAFTGRGPFKYLKYAGAVVLNRHLRLSDVIFMKARDVQVQPVQGLLAQMDGEVLPTLPATVQIADKQVRILFPN
jgi:diacylglycerol kinase (ATP)